MGALKTQVLENAGMEKVSTKQRISQGLKTRTENASTENASTMQTFSHIKQEAQLSPRDRAMRRVN